MAKIGRLVQTTKSLGLIAVIALMVPGQGSAQTFADVPNDHWAFSFIETFAARGITSGCGGGNYCPTDTVTRAQMAVFLERGINGGDFVPPAATGTVFNDVGTADFAANFIERLFADGITAGCGNGNYCPDTVVSRDQMAVFLLRARHGSAYTPAAPSGMFPDVPLGHWAAAWIEQLAAEGITSGCGNGNYCPAAPVRRDQMAVFVVRALLDPPVLTRIQLSQDFLTLDRWGDTATIDAIGVDQDGREVAGVSIAWTSADETIAAVDNTGGVTSWLAGDVDLTVEASLGGVTVFETVAINVAVQRNPACQVPTEFPVKNPVAQPSLWDVRRIPTQFVPDGFAGNVSISRQITLDVDRDGDPDMLSMTGTPELQGIGVPIDTAHRVWLNDGSGYFTDGTDAILGQNGIPWNAPRNMDYADFDSDGFEDIVVFQQGWEFHENGCGNGPGSCPGGPNLLFLPQPGGLSDSAPTRLSPYDTNGFTHSGAVGDVDCDGDIDIFEAQWGNSEADARHHLQLNSGAGTFVADDSLLPQEILPDNGVNGTAMCDLDRDGDPDLVISLADAANPRAIRISVNDGFGRFRMLDSNVLPAITLADGVLCGDLDLDGYSDIVLSVDERSVTIRNLGGMSFEDLTASWLPADPKVMTSNGLGIIDLNNDGWPELTAANDEAIYWNMGNGIFTKSPLHGACCGSFTTVADFDMDGWPDIYLHTASNLDSQNTLYLNRPPPAPVKLVFATSGLYTGNLGGFAGADAICQQHASDAGLPGNYAAFLSGSNQDAINRIPHAEFRRVGDNALVATSKLALVILALDNPVGNDENGTVIVADEGVWTGSDHHSNKQQDTGIGFCSDWSRDTDEDPGLAAGGFVWADGPWWVWATTHERNCSDLQRLYCFQQ